MDNWIQIEKRLDWELTRHCNLECTHCISRFYHRNILSELSTEEAIQVTRRCREGGFNFVHFSGGEPVLNSDFEKLIQQLDRFEIGTTFSTNGTLFNGQLLDTLAALNYFKGVFVSFEDIREKNHDTIRGKGSFTSSLEGIDQFIAKIPEKPVSIAFTLNRNAMVELSTEEIVNFFSQLGADRIIFQDLAIPPQASPEVKSLSYTSKIWLKFIYQLFDPGFKPSIPFVYPIKPLIAHHLNRELGAQLPVVYYGCNGLSTEFRLLPNGILLPCSAAIGWETEYNRYLNQAPKFYDLPSEKIFKLDLYQRFISAKSAKKDPFMEPCRSCHLAYDYCNPCIFGRLSGEIQEIKTCSWIKNLGKEQ